MRARDLGSAVALALLLLLALALGLAGLDRLGDRLLRFWRRASLLHARLVRLPLPGLYGEVQLEVAAADLACRPVADQPPVLEQHGAVTEPLDRAHVVCDEEDRRARTPDARKLVEALLLERRVAD